MGYDLQSPIKVVLVVALVFVPSVLGSYAVYLQLGKHMKQMQTWKKSYNGYIASAETLATQILTETTALNSTINAAIADVDRQVVTQMELANNIYDQLLAYQTNFTLPPAYEPPQAAFQAFIQSGGVDASSWSVTTFKYTDVTLNDGGCYDSAQGVFTAPVGGMYWFHATFKTVTTGSRTANMRRKKYGTTTYETIAQVLYYVSQETACTTLTLLNPGDTVGMYPDSTDPTSTWALDGGYFNTFTGHLVAVWTDPTYVVPTTGAATTATTTAAGATTTAAATTTTANAVG